INGIVNSNFIGQQGIFTGLIVSGITIYVFNKLIQKNVTFKMPDTVPPAVAKSFESLVPGVVTLAIFVIVAGVLNGVFDTSLPEALLWLLQKPALAVAATPLFAVVAIVSTPILQWFGIHGTSVWGPIFGLTWNINDNENIMGTAQHLYSTLFMNFTVVSSGALTLAPIIAIIIFSKRADNKKIAKLAIAPGIFNVSEPVTYGLPIVLNPILFIPYLLSWVIPFFLGQLLTEIGLIPIITNNVPWTVPPILSGLLYSGSI
ncbi:PTS transporter subunit EIIC, partial [Listeria welshimeri]